jgi:hypothetical protein
MAFPLSFFLAQVDNLIGADDAILSQLARYRQVLAAVDRYSTDAPNEIAADVTGAATRYYAVAANLTSWIEGLSRVVSIQYPAPTIASNETPVYLDDDDWRDDYWQAVTTVQTRYLYLPNHQPAATETMRITYTCPWAWSASTLTESITQDAHGFAVGDYLYQETGATAWTKGDVRTATHIVTVKAANSFTAALLQCSIPPADFFAVCDLAASLCLSAIAAKFARSSDSTISADSVNHDARSGSHEARAKDALKRYLAHMGLDKEGEVKAAGMFIDLGLGETPAWPEGRRYLHEAS